MDLVVDELDNCVGIAILDSSNNLPPHPPANINNPPALQSNNPLDVSVNPNNPSGLPPPFELYFLNQSQLPPNRKLAVIILMVADSKNLMFIDDGSTHVITPESFVRDTSPYPEYLGKKGWRKKLIVTKLEIRKEINCRCPTAKTNVSNKSIDKLMSQLL